MLGLWWNNTLWASQARWNYKCTSLPLTIRQSKCKIIRKTYGLINRKGVILHHDNARPHAAKVTQEKIRELNWELLPHPPYSPDIAPSDYYLFRSLEHSIKNKTFQNVNEVEIHLHEYFSSKPASFYKRGIEALPERWQRVVNNDGNDIIDWLIKIFFFQFNPK